MHAEVLIYDGQPEVALDAIDTALKLNPKPPKFFYGLLGEAQYLTGHYEEAVVSLAKADWFRRQRAMTFGHLGRFEEVKAIRDTMPPSTIWTGIVRGSHIIEANRISNI